MGREREPWNGIRKQDGVQKQDGVEDSAFLHSIIGLLGRKYDM